MAEFAREFPLMSVVKLRIEIERAVRDLASKRDVVFDRPVGIMDMLRDLQRHGPMPASAEQMLGALRVMNEASHGVDVDSDAAKRAMEIGGMFLADLKALNLDD